MKKNIIIVGLLIIAVGVVIGIKNRKAESPSDTGCASRICSMPVSRQAKTQEESPDGTPAITHALPKLLDLGADKCIPCKMMTPILDEMKETFDGQLDVEFIDVWKNQAMAKKYGIQSIPTQIFFDTKGNELFRHQGFFPRADMMKKWAELGYHFDEPKK
jgi:thioredoxin 1